MSASIANLSMGFDSSLSLFAGSSMCGYFIALSMVFLSIRVLFSLNLSLQTPMVHDTSQRKTQLLSSPSYPSALDTRGHFPPVIG